MQRRRQSPAADAEWPPPRCRSPAAGKVPARAVRRMALAIMPHSRPERPGILSVSARWAEEDALHHPERIDHGEDEAESGQRGEERADMVGALQYQEFADESAQAGQPQ